MSPSLRRCLFCAKASVVIIYWIAVVLLAVTAFLFIGLTLFAIGLTGVGTITRVGICDHLSTPLESTYTDIMCPASALLLTRDIWARFCRCSVSPPVLLGNAVHSLRSRATAESTNVAEVVTALNQSLAPADLLKLVPDAHLAVSCTEWKPTFMLFRACKTGIFDESLNALVGYLGCFVCTFFMWGVANKNSYKLLRGVQGQSADMELQKEQPQFTEVATLPDPAVLKSKEESGRFV